MKGREIEYVLVFAGLPLEFWWMRRLWTSCVNCFCPASQTKSEDCFKLKEVLAAINLQMREFQRAEVTSLTLLAVNDRKP